MKVAYQDLLDSQNSLGNLGSVRKMVPAIKLRVARVVKQVKPELETFEENRQELLEKLGIYDKEKETFVFPSHEVAKQFKREFDAMKKVTVDIRFGKFQLSDFEKLEEITAIDLANLAWLYGGLDAEAETGEALTAKA
jgi:hypothetical protein